MSRVGSEKNSLRPTSWYLVTLHRVPKTVSCLIITLANVDRFSEFFHQVIRKKILYVHITKISTSPAICCYTTLWKSKIQKNVSDFDSTSTNCWHVPEDTLRTWSYHLTVVRQTVSRLLTLTDWLTFWGLSDDVSNQQVNLIQLNIVASWRFIYHDYLCAVFVLSRLHFMCSTYSSKIISFVWYFCGR